MFPLLSKKLLFSSPEPLGSQGELIVYPSSRRPSVRRPPFSKIFSETAWSIKPKFYVEPPWEGGTKVCINGSGHMTKMAVMPIYGKTFKNLLLQTGSPLILNLGMQHRGLKFYKVCINGEPGLTLTYFTAWLDPAKFRALSRLYKCPWYL